MSTVWLVGLITVQVSPTAILDGLARDYGIEIEVVRQARRERRPGFMIDADPVDPEALEAYAVLLDREWRRYPRTLMVRTKLGRIVIGSRVKVKGQPRAAVPDFGPGWYWLDAAAAAQNPSYGKHVLHHDFYHLIDEHDSPDGRRDVAWAALNPPGTKYGTGGWNMQTRNVGMLRDDLPGFLTQYATSAVEEDKAEIFGHLLVNPAFVARRTLDDAVLAAKVRALKDRLRGFEPALDEAWWTRQGRGSL